MIPLSHLRKSDYARSLCLDLFSDTVNPNLTSSAIKVFSSFSEAENWFRSLLCDAQTPPAARIKIAGFLLDKNFDCVAESLRYFASILAKTTPTVLLMATLYELDRKQPVFLNSPRYTELRLSLDRIVNALKYLSSDKIQPYTVKDLAKKVHDKWDTIHYTAFRDK